MMPPVDDAYDITDCGVAAVSGGHLALLVDECGLAEVLREIIAICRLKAERAASQHRQNAARGWRADAMRLEKAFLKTSS
jgi:hypothetical protein